MCSLKLFRVGAGDHATPYIFQVIGFTAIQYPKYVPHSLRQREKDPNSNASPGRFKGTLFRFEAKISIAFKGGWGRV